MKIFSGKFKGRNIYMPAGIRPTQNVTRQAIFNLLGHDMTGLEVLELFAGSGSVGIEALSRGAKHVTFVDHDAKCSEVIRQNLIMLGYKPEIGEPIVQVLHSDAFAAIKTLANRGRKFDLVFFDPPYGLDLGKKALKTLNAYDILHPNCFVVVEYSKRERLPGLQKPGACGSGLGFRNKVYEPPDTNHEVRDLTPVTDRQYGKSYLAVYQYLKPQIS